jgi:glutamate carboxypeptidase
MKIFALLAAVLLTCSAYAGDGLSESFKKLWLDAVNLNSGTDNADGLNQVRKLLIPQFEKLGFKSQVIEGGLGHKVVVLRVPGGQPRVALIAHLDTVFAKDSPFQKAVVEGEWIQGPGAQDMKGGVILMLDVLNELHDPALLKQVVVLLNDDEETGSMRSATILKEQLSGASYALVYEGPTSTSDSVTTTESGVDWIELTVKGQAAHAGVNPEDGINACVELGQKLVEVARLADPKRHVTVNVGVVQGGTKPNVVCEEASARIDIRFVNPADLERVRKGIDRIAAKSLVYNSKLKRGTQSEVKELVLVPSLSGDLTKDLFKIAHEEAKKMGLDLKGEHIGGASDGNQLASTGVKILSGLGVYGQNPHTNQERADLASYGLRKKLSILLLQKLLAK